MNSIKQIKSHFQNALQALLILADETCLNTLPDKIVFIKCYSLYSPLFHIEDRFLYELRCLQKRAFYNAEDIINDIHLMGLKGKIVSWVDLTLYYASFKETVILVNLLYSDSDTPTEYHVSIRRTGQNLLESRFNLNDYVEELKNGCRQPNINSK